MFIGCDTLCGRRRGLGAVPHRGTNTGGRSYSWGVIDADAAPETGDGGFEYCLSAYHIVRPGQKRDSTKAPMEEVAKAGVWEIQPGGIAELREASLEV